MPISGDPKKAGWHNGSKFRNSQNILYTQKLFFETSTDKDTVVYTLKDWDHNGYPSLYRLYMETEDPTEWAFATQYLDSWEHWERLTSTDWFRPYAERWRKELELKIRSKQLARIMQTAGADSKESYQAQKLLLQGGWLTESEKPKRGRPSKEEIHQAAVEAAEAETRVDDDYNRIIGVLN